MIRVRYPTRIDNGALAGWQARLRQGFEEARGGHWAQEATRRESVDWQALATRRDFIGSGAQRFVEALKRLESLAAPGSYDQLIAMTRSVVSEMKQRPWHARAAQARGASRAGAGRALEG